MTPLQVDLVAAERTVWTGQATQVSAPAADGEVGILPGHAPLLSVLQTGLVRITPVDGAGTVVRIDSGFLSVDHDRVTVVVNHADPTDTSEDVR